MRFFSLLCLTFLIFATPVFAQGKGKEAPLPEVPEALQALADRGAQLRYLGAEHGMDGWIAIYQGQEQYYYVTADKKAFVTGLMFGNDGRPITIDQVKNLQAQSGDVLDLLAADQPETQSVPEAPESVVSTMAMKSPSERLFAEVERSNWLVLGDSKAPVLYSFVDPNCPHCHDFINDILKAGYIDNGALQVRLIPVGFQNGSLAQASFLLASPDGADRYVKYLDGDTDALPAKSDVSTQAVQKNMALMQAWKFNVTPLTIYRSGSGEVKILRGRAKDLSALVADLAAGGTPVSAPAR